MPLGPSMPTSARATPMKRAPRPRTTDSETTEEIARKAKTARAKYSAGPKEVAIVTSTGEKNTTTVVEMRPPMKAPIAAVASATAALPWRAMRCPSKVEAIAEDCPGVFSRIPAVESPNRPPKYTPANMMNAAVGSRAKVIGSSSATAIEEPRPGRTPTAVPSTAPISTNSRL